MVSLNLNKRAQQEMVGFVLIVVIVIIGMVVFMIFSLRQNDVVTSDIANNILSSIMKTTSECALTLTYEPDFEDMRDLFKSCYERKSCGNIGEKACDVLERSIEGILDEVILLEPVISAYQLDFFHVNDLGSESYFHLLKGDCEGDVYGSEPHSIRISSEENLLVTLKICVYTLDT